MKRHRLPLSALAAALLLAGCSTGNDGSMIGALWQWPGAVISGTVSNTIYNARRNRVKEHVAARFDAIKEEARAGAGPDLEEAARRAEVPAARKGELYTQLRDNHASYFDKDSREDAIEAVVVAFMVYGGP